MSNEKVRVERKAIRACVTCPICKDMLKDATTISECLHSFCRKCIYSKLSEGNLRCCPICNTDLGCVPEEKLRSNYYLRELTTQIFPSKRRNLDMPKVVSSVACYSRREKMPLSSSFVKWAQDDDYNRKMSLETANTEESDEGLETVASKHIGESVDEPWVDPDCPVRDGDPLPKKQRTISQDAKVIEIGLHEGWTGDKSRPLQVFESFNLAQDDDYYSNMSRKEHVLNLKSHLGEFMSDFGRMVAMLEAEIEEKDRLHADLKKVKQAFEAAEEKFKFSLEESLQKRDRLSVALEKMTEEKNRACASLNFMTAEKDKVCSGLLKQRNQLDVDLWAMTKERDRLAVDLQAMTKERDGLAIDLQAMTKERDGISVDLQVMAMYRDELALDLQAMTKQRDHFLRDAPSTYLEGFNDCYDRAVKTGYIMTGHTLADILYRPSDRKTDVGQGSNVADEGKASINKVVYKNVEATTTTDDWGQVYVPDANGYSYSYDHMNRTYYSYSYSYDHMNMQMDDADKCEPVSIPDANGVLINEFPYEYEEDAFHSFWEI